MLVAVRPVLLEKVEIILGMRNNNLNSLFLAQRVM